MIHPRPHVLSLAGLIILCSVNIGLSQSVFSAQGIGEIRPMPGARLQGMGSIGIALVDSLQLTIANPALPASINRTRVAISGGYQWLNVQDNITSDARDHADVYGVAIAIPFYNHWTFSAAIDPFTVANSSWYFPRQFNNLSYEEQYLVTGGISRGSLGIAFPFRDRVWLGGGVRVLFGTVDQVYTINFISSQYRDAQYTNRLHSLSAGVTLGAVWEFYPGWSIGGLYYTSQSGDGTLNFSYVDSDSVRTTKRTLSFPAALGVGFSGSVYPRVRVVSDLLWTQWENATVSVERDLPLADTWKVSVGAELQPLFGGIEPFYNRLYYRVGVSTENHYMENAAGNAPRLTLIHAGLGFPFRTDQRIDLAFQWGIRGDVGEFGAKETLFGISVTIEAAEKWFVRRR